jgi:ABC-type uncharacterized transport system substrate-binding protein
MTAIGLVFMLTFGLIVAPVGSEAQLRTNSPRVGVLEPGSPLRADETSRVTESSRCLNGFQQGLRNLGYVEGHNIILDYRYAEGKPERFSSLAADLVRLMPDVIWTHSGRMALVAKADKILQGAKPADLPVGRADTFYLIVNLQTASALGMTIPPMFLFQADEVIK